MKYIYLHGFASGPGSSKARFFQDRFVQTGRELLIPDFAAGDFEHLTITGQLAVLESAVGGAPAVLIGSSMGGYLAALYAARRPEVQRLLLMAPAFGFARRWPESMQPETMAAWRRTGWLEVYHYGDKRPRRLSSSLLDDAAAYEDLPAFTQPALIFHGTRDTVVPPAYSEQFVSLHPNARLQLLESDHQLLDVFDTIWDRSQGFLFDSAR